MQQIDEYMRKFCTMFFGKTFYPGDSLVGIVSELKELSCNLVQLGDCYGDECEPNQTRPQ